MHRLSFVSLLTLSLMIISCWPKTKDALKAVDTPDRKPVPKPDATTELTLIDQMAKFESDGILPKLDRSDNLPGPDLNKDGIRDDVEAYIESQRLTPQQKKAARQTARAMQRALFVDAGDANAINKVRIEGTEARNCLYSTFPKSDVRSATNLSRSLTAITLNTRARTQAFLRYDSALSGSSWRLPNHDTCKN